MGGERSPLVRHGESTGQEASATSCYVNLQGKKKTLPLSGTSNRLTHFRCVLNSALGRPVNDRKLLG